MCVGGGVGVDGDMHEYVDENFVRLGQPSVSASRVLHGQGRPDQRHTAPCSSPILTPPPLPRGEPTYIYRPAGLGVLFPMLGPMYRKKKRQTATQRPEPFTFQTR